MPLSTRDAALSDLPPPHAHPCLLSISPAAGKNALFVLRDYIPPLLVCEAPTLFRTPSLLSPFTVKVVEEIQLKKSLRSAGAEGARHDGTRVHSVLVSRSKTMLQTVKEYMFTVSSQECMQKVRGPTYNCGHKLNVRESYYGGEELIERVKTQPSD